MTEVIFPPGANIEPEDFGENTLRPENGPHSFSPDDSPASEGLRSAVDTVLDRASKLPLLTAHQEKLLGFRIQQGDTAARNQMVEHNLRLLMKFIRPYMNKGVSREDLFMDGTLGLQRAAEKFDPTMNIKFSTYASWWIKQAYERSIAAQATTIRVPTHVHDRWRRIRRAKVEISQMTGIDIDHYDSSDEAIAEVAEYTAMEFHHVQEAEEAFRNQPISMNFLIGNDKDGEFGDLLSNADLEGAEAVEEQDIAAEIDEAKRADALNRSLGKLGLKTQALIELRYGLDGSEPLTLTEASRELNISFDRAAELEKQALGQLAAMPELRLAATDPDNFEADKPIKRSELFSDLIKKHRVIELTYLNAELNLIAHFIYLGKTTEEIAQLLKLTPASVKYTINNPLYDEFGVNQLGMVSAKKRPEFLVRLGAEYSATLEEVAA